MKLVQYIQQTDDENIIIENLLEKPGMYLHELQYEISSITGTQVDESTICRFLKRNNFTHKRLSICSLMHEINTLSKMLHLSSRYQAVCVFGLSWLNQNLVIFIYLYCL